MRIRYHEQKGLEASYMVRNRFIIQNIKNTCFRTGKPHTIVEDLILPAAADMAGTMLGEKAKKIIQTMISNTFFKMHQ